MKEREKIKSVFFLVLLWLIAISFVVLVVLKFRIFFGE